MTWSPSLLALVVIPLTVGPCVLDQALVTHVPPNTAHVITVSECGAMKCWVRWIEVSGKRAGETSACSASDASSAGTFTIAPPPPNVP